MDERPARDPVIVAVIVGAAAFVLAPALFAQEGDATYAFTLALIDRALLAAGALAWYRKRAR